MMRDLGILILRLTLGGFLAGHGAQKLFGAFEGHGPEGTGKAHAGKPIWITSGGAELPATNIAMALALVLLGPGRLSIDAMFGIPLHPVLAALASTCVAAGTLVALSQPRPDQTERQSAEQQAHFAEPAPEPAAAT